MTPVKQFLEKDECGTQEEKTMRQQTTWFILIGSNLYRRGYTQPLLKCISQDQAYYVTREIHEHHQFSRAPSNQWANRSCQQNNS